MVQKSAPVKDTTDNPDALSQVRTAPGFTWFDWTIQWESTILLLNQRISLTNPGNGDSVCFTQA